MEALQDLCQVSIQGIVGSPRALPSRRNPSVPLMGPGARLLTRMFWGPHSTARCRVIASAWKEGRREGECRAVLPSGVAWVQVRALYCPLG